MRTFLDGRFENSAFCLLSPDGQDWLSKAGRGPQHVLGRRTSDSVRQMERVAEVYGSIADPKDALVPDFHSVRQALNVASADQRILVLVHGPDKATETLHKSLREVSNDDRIVGRFHFDFDSTNSWQKNVTGVASDSGICLIRPDEFGMKGSVMKQLPLSADNSDVISALIAANSEFAATTEKKVYSSHVSKGQQLGIYFEGAVPYGEDRDGDGQIDRAGRGGGGGGRSRSRNSTRLQQR